VDLVVERNSLGQDVQVNEGNFLLTANIPQFSETDRIYMIFVDSISICGSFEAQSIIGCALINGNRQIVESGWAARPIEAELLAH